MDIAVVIRAVKKKIEFQIFVEFKIKIHIAFEL